MRAVVLHEWGTPGDLAVEDVPAPQMHPGGVRIQVAAAAINFADTVMIEGRYQWKGQLPVIPGLEVSGTVTEVAPDVTRCKPGDRVIANLTHGGYAEEAVADSRFVWKVPEGMDMLSAAGVSVVYGTSYLALTDRAGLKAGETLLVHAAAGGVGLAAVEIGKALGATVIAAAGSEAKLAIAEAHGADHLIDYSNDDVRTRVKALTGGRGADVIFDPVGGEVFDASLRCVAWRGRIIIIGFASGTIPQIPANILLVKHVAAMGFFWGSYKEHAPGIVTDSLDEMLKWYGDGKIKPRVSMTFALAEAPKALEALLARESTGKIVLTTEL